MARLKPDEARQRLLAAGLDPLGCRALLACLEALGLVGDLVPAPWEVPQMVTSVVPNRRRRR